jgi:3-dehydro-4-phosphotetronate decarboxylase
MTENQARDEICRIGRSLFERGYVHGSAGNISQRLDDGFLITPTDACLGFLDPARLSRLDGEGRHVSGEPASKTMALHATIYRAACRLDPATACVIHTHSTHCVALSMQVDGAELLPALTPYFVMKVGHVPLLRYTRPGSPAAVAAVAQAIDDAGARAGPCAP